MSESSNKPDGRLLANLARLLDSGDPENDRIALDIVRNLGDATLRYFVRAATKDLKTGLENQAMLEQAVLEILNSVDENGLVIVTDIVGFKHINDTYGQAVGDEVLAAYAEALQSTIRTNIDDDNPVTDGIYKLKPKPTSDEHAFRIGGDEYSVLLRNGANLALADHEALVRTKLINSLNNQAIISVLIEYGISRFGVRASFAFVKPTEHKDFSDVLRSMGSKQDSICEYSLLSDRGGCYTVLKVH